MAESKTAQWFKANVVENEEDLITVGELANKVLHKNLSLGINDPKTTIAVYCNIFESICGIVASKEEEWSDFCLNVVDRLKVGYTTTDNEDDEKSGNFMVFLQHAEKPASSNDEFDEDEDDTITLCTQWNAANIKEQADVLKEIGSKGMKHLSEIINVKIESLEIIIPLFCYTHDELIKFMRIKRAESDDGQYELNMAGLFTIGIRETSDGDEEIYYVPSITLKLMFKNDAIATGSQED